MSAVQSVVLTYYVLLIFLWKVSQLNANPSGGYLMPHPDFLKPIPHFGCYYLNYLFEKNNHYRPVETYTRAPEQLVVDDLFTFQDDLDKLFADYEILVANHVMNSVDPTIAFYHHYRNWSSDFDFLTIYNNYQVGDNPAPGRKDLSLSLQLLKKVQNNIRQFRSLAVKGTPYLAVAYRVKDGVANGKDIYDHSDEALEKNGVLHVVAMFEFQVENKTRSARRVHGGFVIMHPGEDLQKPVIVLKDNEDWSYVSEFHDNTVNPYKATSKNNDSYVFHVLGKNRDHIRVSKFLEGHRQSVNDRYVIVASKTFCAAMKEVEKPNLLNSRIEIKKVVSDAVVAAFTVDWESRKITVEAQNNGREETTIEDADKTLDPNQYSKSKFRTLLEKVEKELDQGSLLDRILDIQDIAKDKVFVHNLSEMRPNKDKNRA